jgi:peptidoglycan/LPS O-acetylase OafA/YrhL
VTAGEDLVGHAATEEPAVADHAASQPGRWFAPSRLHAGLSRLSAALFDADREETYERSIDTNSTSSGQAKNPAFDGLRGLACILVVLGHSRWIIVPPDVIESTGPMRGLFFSESLAVIVFFVMGGFLVTRSLLDTQRRIGAIPVGRFWLRRLVRIGAQVVPFAAVILVVSIFDRWDTYSGEQTRRSLVNILRFTFNWSLVNDPLGNRDDLGHLWYLSVEQQVYLVLVMLLVWLARYRLSLVTVLCGGAIAVIINRWLVFDQEGWYVATLRTLTRADGLLLGSAAAVLFSVLRRFRSVARTVTLPALGVVAFLVLLSPQLSTVAFLQTQGIAFVVAATILVLATAVAAQADGLAERLLSWSPFRFFGIISFPLYIWHLPVYHATQRWAGDLPWLTRAAIAVASLVVIVGIMQVAVERPVGRWLDRNRHSASGAEARMAAATA